MLLNQLLQLSVLFLFHPVLLLHLFVDYVTDVAVVCGTEGCLEISDEPELVYQLAVQVPVLLVDSIQLDMSYVQLGNQFVFLIHESVDVLTHFFPHHHLHSFL